MNHETLYCSGADEKLLTDESSDHKHDAEALLLPRIGWGYVQSGFIKRCLPWIAHGMSILICITLLFYTTTLYSESRRSYIKKYYAYCEFVLKLSRYAILTQN